MAELPRFPINRPTPLPSCRGSGGGRQPISNRTLLLLVVMLQAVSVGVSFGVWLNTLLVLKHMARPAAPAQQQPVPSMRYSRPGVRPHLL